jgi:hypothetical protein
MDRKLRMGMVGGGNDAFIGAVHRLAAFMDGQIELVCGVFSVDPEISKQSGREYFVPDNRIYANYKEMFEKEAQLPEGERMDFVTIVTPNFLHFDPAMMALDHGFNVVLDKPITFTLEEALQLRKKVEETGLLAGTYTYLFRVSGREAGPEDGQRWGFREDQKGDRRVSPGMARLEGGGQRERPGLLADRSEALGKGGLYGRYRHTCPPPGRIYQRIADH